MDTIYEVWLTPDDAIYVRADSAEDLQAMIDGSEYPKAIFFAYHVWDKIPEPGLWKPNR